MLCGVKVQTLTPKQPQPTLLYYCYLLLMMGVGISALSLL